MTSCASPAAAACSMRTFLHLASGETFPGESFGAHVPADGEVVFTTGMVGYPESMTDPSFRGQILTFTYPLIGNYGLPKPKPLDPHLLENFESEEIQVEGIVVSEHCLKPSHRTSISSLSAWMEQSGKPGIAGVDTRRLTQVLREKGTIRGKISPAKSVHFEPTGTRNLVAEASITRVLTYHGRSGTTGRPHIVLIDCGVKHGIIRALLALDYRITRIPWDMDPAGIKDVDGIVCSNGPGDPKDCQVTVSHIREAVFSRHVPFLGICLGHQLLALAAGADTYKMLYGHRGINQPCVELPTNRAYITSQNHGYAVDEKSLPPEFEPWFRNLNDRTNEGIRHKTLNVKSTQFHPEGHPGPFDAIGVFKFI